MSDSLWSPLLLRFQGFPGGALAVKVCIQTRRTDICAQCDYSLLCLFYYVWLILLLAGSLLAKEQPLARSKIFVRSSRLIRRTVL